MSRINVTEALVNKLNNHFNGPRRLRRESPRTDLSVPFKFVHNEYYESSRVKARPALQTITKRYISGHGKVRVGTNTGDVFEIMRKDGKDFDFVAVA